MKSNMRKNARRDKGAEPPRQDEVVASQGHDHPAPAGISRRRFLKSGAAIAAGSVLYTTPRMLAASPPGQLLSSCPKLTGDVVCRGDTAAYEAARTNFNPAIQAKPALVVFCNNVTDVQNAVAWARCEKMPISVRSGRHSLEGFSIGPGIVIDVSAMNSVRVKRDRQDRLVAHIETGAQLLCIYETLFNHSPSVTIPGGSCPTVGIAGLTLGGGFGLLARQYGLTCDNLLSAKMVNHAGKLLTASPTKNRDLFWGLRGGGGGNFGIATSFKFSVHAIDGVVIYRVGWPRQQMHSVINAWQHWAPFVPDGLTCELGLSADPTKDMPVFSKGQFVGTGDGSDPKDGLMAILNNGLLDKVPAQPCLETVPFIDAVRLFGGLNTNAKADSLEPQLSCEPHAFLDSKCFGGTFASDGLVAALENQHPSPGPQLRYKTKSSYVRKPLTPKAIKTIVTFLENNPSPPNTEERNKDGLQFDAYGGAVNRVRSSATAFPHRGGTLFHIQYGIYWTEADEGDDVACKKLAWIREFYAAMRPFVSRQSYRNYPDVDLVDWQQAYHVRNFPRLVRVKRRYDPDNVFNFAQSIPTRR